MTNRHFTHNIQKHKSHGVTSKSALDLTKYRKKNEVLGEGGVTSILSK